MTDAPDPGLTDLIAAHICVEPLMCGCGFYVQSTEEWAKHLALVVEQYTNGRITELETELEKYKSGGRTLGKMIDRTLKDVVAAVGAEDMIDEDGDYALIFEQLAELRPARDVAIARAEKAEATIARVEALKGDLFLRGGNLIAQWGAARLIGAALEGEQQ